jgi:cytoskeleton protein RodZ
MPALGDRFRSAREARGLSLSDVSEQIRIRSIYLAAIEDENWSAIGAPVYVRGFLRTYARFLGLDPEEVVASFNGEIPPPGIPWPPGGVTEAQSAPEPARGRRSAGYLIWIAGIVAVLLVGFVVYNEVSMHQQAETVASTAAPSAAPSPLPSNASPPAGPASAESSPAALAAASGPPSPSPCPSPSPGAAPSPCPSPSISAEQIAALGPQTLAIVLTAPSWLRVTVDGSVSMEGTFAAGTAKAFHGKAAVVRVGNAGGVRIYVDGKDVGKLGNSGDVIDRSFAL